jgi:hypothetical protein
LVQSFVECKVSLADAVQNLARLKATNFDYTVRMWAERQKFF